MHLFAAFSKHTISLYFSLIRPDLCLCSTRGIGCLKRAFELWTHEIEISTGQKASRSCLNFYLVATLTRMKSIGSSWRLINISFYLLLEDVNSLPDMGLHS